MASHSLDNIRAINTSLRDGSIKEIRLNIPHLGKNLLFSSVCEALSKSIEGGFNKNTHLAWFTRAANGTLGSSPSAYFILFFKDLQKYEQKLALKQLKVSTFTLDVCCALSDAPPPTDQSFDAVVVLTGLVPCLFEHDIILNQVSRYVDFEFKNITISRDKTGKATIIVSHVKAFLPLELVFANKFGHTHVVKVQVLNYKPEHKDLDSFPLEPSIPLTTDDPEWFFSSGTKKREVFKPPSCTYCKQIGHVNTIDKPCPLLLINMVNDFCRTCEKKGHRTEYCSLRDQACKIGHHFLDKEACKNQYCPPYWFFDPENPALSRNIKGFDRKNPSTFHLIASVEVGSSVSSGSVPSSASNLNVESSSQARSNNSHLDDFVTKKSKNSRPLSANQNSGLTTVNRFSLLESDQAVDDDNIVDFTDDSGESSGQTVPNLNQIRLGNPAISFKKPKKRVRTNTQPVANSPLVNILSPVSEEADDDAMMDSVISQLDKELNTQRSDTISESIFTQVANETNNKTMNSNTTDPNAMVSLSVPTSTTGPDSNASQQPDLPTSETVTCDDLAPDLTSLPVSQSSGHTEKPPDEIEAVSDLPSPHFESASGSSCDGESSLPDFNPPQVTEDDAMPVDDTETTLTLSRLSDCSKEPSTDTWNITFQSKLDDIQKARLGVIKKAFETNQMGRNRKFDYFRRFMMRHNVDLLVTPGNYKSIFEQVQSIGDLPDFKSNQAKMKTVTAALNCIIRLGRIDNQNSILPGFPSNNAHLKTKARASSGDLLRLSFDSPQRKSKPSRSRSFSGSETARSVSGGVKNGATNTSLELTNIKNKLSKSIMAGNIIPKKVASLAISNKTRTQSK